MGLGSHTKLPRFNMPLELGLFLGCKFFGSKAHSQKACLILDSDRYRYRASIFDISGQDVHSHSDDPGMAIAEVRNWIATLSGEKKLPGGASIYARYKLFVRDLPKICRKMKRRPQDLTFADFTEMIDLWLAVGR